MSFAENLKHRIESLDDRIAFAERDVANIRIGIAEMCGERSAFMSVLATFQETQAAAAPAPRMNIREAVFDQIYENGPMTIEEIAKAIGRYPSQIKSAMGALVGEDKVAATDDEDGRWKLVHERVPHLTLPERAAS